MRKIALLAVAAILACGLGTARGDDVSNGQPAQEQLYEAASSVAHDEPNLAARAEALGVLAAAYRQAGMTEQADAVAKEAAAMEEGVLNLELVRVRISKSYEQVGMLDEAHALIQTMQNPRVAVPACRDLVVAYLKAGKPEKALVVLGEAHAHAAELTNRRLWSEALLVIATGSADAPDGKAAEPVLSGLFKEAHGVETLTERLRILRALAGSARGLGLPKVAGRACDAMEHPAGMVALLELASESGEAGRKGDAASLLARAQAQADSLPPAVAAPWLAQIAHVYAEAGLQTQARDGLERLALLAQEAPDAVSDRVRSETVMTHLALGELEAAAEAGAPMAGRAAGNGAFIALAGRYAAEGRYDEALAHAGNIEGDAARSEAVGAVAEQCESRGDYDRLPALLEQISDETVLARTLKALAAQALEKGELDRTEELAAAIRPFKLQDDARRELADRLPSGGPAGTLAERARQAERLASGIQNEGSRAWALARVANAFLDSGSEEDAARLAKKVDLLADRATGIPELREITVLFARLGDESGADRFSKRCYDEIRRSGCGTCRRDEFLAFGRILLDAGLPARAEQSFVEADDPIVSYVPLLDVAEHFAAAGQAAQAQAVAAVVLDLAAIQMAPPDRVAIICAVARWHAATGLPLTQREKDAASVLATPPGAEAGPVDPDQIKLVYFYQVACPYCGKAEKLLEELQREMPEVEIEHRELDLRSDKQLNIALAKRVNLPSEDRLMAPSVFSLKQALVGDDITLDSLKELAEASRGLPAPWMLPRQDTMAASKDLEQEYKALTTLAVVGAALADGVNPCAFGVIIFFIGYMAFAGKTRKEMFRAGLVYTVAVFVTYLAIGMGLLGFFKYLNARSGESYILPTVLRTVLALGVLAAAVLSFIDGFRLLDGNVKDVSLKLPDKLKSKARHLMTSTTRQGLTLAGMIVLGFLVAMLEFPCTGQVYGVVTYGISQWAIGGLASFGWLVLYNVLFILPLVAVFSLLLAGLSSESLTAFYQRHLAPVKFALGTVFVGLFAWLMVATVSQMP